jgi:hypothetical protein
MKVIPCNPKPSRKELEAAFVDVRMLLSCILHLTNEANRQMHGLNQTEALQIIAREGSEMFKKYRTLLPEDKAIWEREHEILNNFLCTLPTPLANRITL